MRDFRELRVWRKAHELALHVYRASERFPREERFGLTAQLRRAAVSIPTNIAEGCGRSGDREMAHFLSIALGSASEVEYLILFASELNLLPNHSHQELQARVEEVKKMLTAYRKAVVQRLRTPDP